MGESSSTARAGSQVAPEPVERPLAAGPAELTLLGLRRLGPRSECDEEPIHLSGAIQPHGFLLGVDPADLVVRVASENLAAFTGTVVAEAIGRDLAEVIGPEAAGRLAPLVTAEPDVRFDPVRVDLEGRTGTAEFDVLAHRSGPLTLLEFEPGAGADGESTAFQQVIRTALDPDLSSVDVRELCAATARTVQQLTGFDRVLVYKFDDDAHGVVVAETTATDKPVRSLLGLHYPAGDIPRQARALFLTKRIRAIPDVAYEPVALRGEGGQADGTGLDLTSSDLRSVSPVHLRYLQQQGIAGTLTLSLVCGDTLWGMVLCHHDTPRYISARVRALCETLAHTLALQLLVRRSLVGRERAASRARTVAAIVSVLGETRDDAVVDETLAEALFDLIPADTVLLHLDGRTARPGHGLRLTPGAVDRLVEVAAAAVATEPGGWSTDRLLERIAPLGPGDALGGARGLLAVAIGPGAADTIVWVRGETALDVEWAGPAVPAPPGATPADSGAPGDPRHDRTGSTRQSIRDRSAPWTPEDLEAAATLVQSLPQAVLRRTHRRFAERDAGSRAALAASTSRQEKLERDLQRKLRLEALGKMAGGVAHDFNNLLGVILSHAELIDDTIRTAVHLGAPELRQLTDDSAEVLASTQRAARLTRQLLSFARREVTQPRVLSINRVVTDLVDLLDRSVGAHIHLDLALSEAAPTVLIDPDQLERVIVNLAVNARDAMPGGGTLVIATSVSHRAAGQPADADPGDPAHPAGADSAGADSAGADSAGAGPRVRLRVTDTGCGIPADILENVFDPFFTTKVDGEGTGLGLSTVDSIVDQAGGHVDVRSQVGVGTSVTIDLPWAARPAAADAVEPPTAPAPPTQQTVLLVDDEPGLRSGVRRSLQSAGYRVLEAANGPAAIALADSHPEPIHLLVTDVVMPGMLGREVATRVRATRPTMKVLFMSGFALAATNGTGQLDPTDALIDKPFRRVDLLAKISELR